MGKPRFEIADVFRKHGDAYRSEHPLAWEQAKAMGAIECCRTRWLGGHVEACDHCGASRNHYNSCRNRHCPKCQAMAKERWLEARKAELLPCGYFHMVFTLPHVLNALVLANRKLLLDALFAAVKETLAAFARDPQWRLGGQLGFLAILHTWSQTLIDHFHLHCLIPAGVLDRDKQRWIQARTNYLFRIESLAMEFKKRYLAKLRAMLEEDRLLVPEGFAPIQAMAMARSKDWIVYAKKPFAGPEQVLTYLGRYTHRVAIANHRIVSIAEVVSEVELPVAADRKPLPAVVDL